MATVQVGEGSEEVLEELLEAMLVLVFDCDVFLVLALVVVAFDFDELFVLRNFLLVVFLVWLMVSKVKASV